jgi:GNAT superfamily N-acetyltransferase
VSVSRRPARADDRDFLYEVYASTRLEELSPLGWDEAQVKAFLEMQFAAQHDYYQSQFPDADFQIVIEDGRPIGQLYVDRRADEIRIIDIALLPARRGAGLGSGLLKGILEEAAESERPVRIHVEQFNPALRLYERLGFARIGDQGVYLLMEWTP